VEKKSFFPTNWVKNGEDRQFFWYTHYIAHKNRLENWRRSFCEEHSFGRNLDKNYQFLDEDCHLVIFL